MPPAITPETRDGSMRPVQLRRFIEKENTVKYGARNKMKAKVKSIKSGDIMSLVKFDVTLPTEMASVLTTESMMDLGLKVGEEVQLIIKAIHVLPVKE
jgi:molybdopterin-binding protein